MASENPCKLAMSQTTVMFLFIGNANDGFALWSRKRIPQSAEIDLARKEYVS
jgi:hypothetical protein